MHNKSLLSSIALLCIFSLLIIGCSKQKTSEEATTTNATATTDIATSPTAQVNPENWNRVKPW